MIRKILASLTLLVALAGCDNTRSLPGGFALQMWEDGKTFYLVGPGGANQEGGGAIGGTVIRLAWNNELIAVERHANFRGDPDGWMVIDTATKHVTGPITAEQFGHLQAAHKLRVRAADEAWAEL
jgi:hypothetical protein